MFSGRSGRTRRRVGALVAVAVVLQACGGSGTEESNSSTAATETTSVPATEPAASDAASTTTAEPATTEPSGPPPLLEDGMVSDAALAVVITEDGEVDQAVLAGYGAELEALPLDRLEAVVADLSLRAELEAAALSGLEAAVGDRVSTEAALTDAYAQIWTQIDAAAAGLDMTPSPSGFRRVAPAPTSASAQGIAMMGLFMGYMALGLMASAIVEGSNKYEPGQDSYHEDKNTVAGASLDEVGVELTYSGTETNGVQVDFTTNTLIHPCPDPDGKFTIDALIDVRASKDGTGQNAKMTLKIDGTVDDNAELADKNVEQRVEWADFAGGKGQFLDMGGSGATGFENVHVNRTGGNLTENFVKLTTFLSVTMSLLISQQLVNAAERGWKSGRCVKLNVTPSAGPDGLAPSEVVQVLAEPRSKIDGSPTGGDVTATLSSGATSVEPNGSPVPADANSTYTAAPEQDQKGTVAYESRSRRGVGKADITFSTSKPAAYQVVGGLQDWQVNMVVCDIMKPFTLEAPGIGTAEFSGGLTGDYSATGIYNISYQGTYQITLENGLGTPGSMVATSGGSTAGSAGSGSENYVLTPATC